MKHFFCLKGGLIFFLNAAGFRRPDSSPALAERAYLVHAPGQVKFCILLFFLGFSGLLQAQTVSTAGTGWSGNSVNAVIFRKNSLTSWNGNQYIAYYDGQKNVVLGCRKPGASGWITRVSPYRGNAADAHRSISLMADGEGYLHLSWDHHGNALHYAVSVAPGSLEMGPERPMTGLKEQQLTYPEFYRLADGGLLFLYRDGASGKGSLMINRYSLHSRQWTQVQDGLIDGEGKRSPYWQLAVDAAGIIHLSWVWRESPDVASNHDLCYARSADGGRSWEKSTGEKYRLPITQAGAEYAAHIPQHSELINQTSMFADAAGKPFIATYWLDPGTQVPQYHIVWKTGTRWQTRSLHFRKTPFSLSGEGTKRIPLSRPQVLAWKEGRRQAVALLFRDAERGSRVSLAVNRDFPGDSWVLKDLTRESAGAWEPSYDTELWKEQQVLSLFVQRVEQPDAEGLADTPPTPVQVINYPLIKKIKSKQ